MTPSPTHSEYLRLDHAPVAHRSAYRTLFEGCVSAEQCASIRAHLASQRTYGSDRFREAIERQLGRSLQITPRGQPRRAGA
jgi:hypothetical protein